MFEGAKPRGEVTKPSRARSQGLVYKASFWFILVVHTSRSLLVQVCNRLTRAVADTLPPNIASIRGGVREVAKSFSPTAHYEHGGWQHVPERPYHHCLRKATIACGMLRLLVECAEYSLVVGTPFLMNPCLMLFSRGSLLNVR